MEALLLRFDAPLMSFGGPVVDNLGVTDRWPGVSMLTGLLANALGFDHREPDRIEELQRRLRYAVRRDRAGTRLLDYQTVDLGQDHLSGGGWTTSGRGDDRAGASSETTHIRFRHYLSDAVYTVALTIDAGGPLHLDQLEAALEAPERPLFLGRKCCIPAAPLLLGRVECASLLAALESAPRLEARCDEGMLAAYWSAEEGDEVSSAIVEVTDERDWRNQIHVGRRFMREGALPSAQGENGGAQP